MNKNASNAKDARKREVRQEEIWEFLLPILTASVFFAPFAALCALSVALFPICGRPEWTC